MNKKEKPIRGSKQAIEIIVARVAQEKQTNPTFQDMKLEELKVFLKSTYQNRWPSLEDPEDFQKMLKVLLEETNKDMNLSKFVDHFSKLFSEVPKQGKLQQKLSKNSGLIALIGSLSSILALILPFIVKNGSLTDQLLSYPLSFVSGMNNNPKPIFRWKK